MGIAGAIVWLFARAAEGPAPPRWLERGCTLGAIAALRIYRLGWNRLTGRRCMFRHSCSHFSLDTIRERGWTEGRGLIMRRLQQCDGRYRMSFDGVCCSMTTSDDLVHAESDIAPWLVETYKRDHAKLVSALSANPP
tara:strand:+ start:1294 stop:1704 length:411 start_codon:yes stop_codon:yes gene_type:complete